MKIVIGKPSQVGPGWTPFPADAFMTPREIRLELERIVAEDEAKEESTLQIVTMNYTVLDMIHSAESKNKPLITYDETYVVVDKQIVPLLERHNEEWLCMCSLGDLHNCERIGH
jgi:hypothetical protein